MDNRRPADHNPAAIIIGSDFLALAIRWHQIGFRLRMLVQRVHFTDHAVIMAFAPCAEEIARFCPGAVNFLALDQFLDMAERVGGIGEKGGSFIGRHRLGEVALADIDAA